MAFECQRKSTRMRPSIFVICPVSLTFGTYDSQKLKSHTKGGLEGQKEDPMHASWMSTKPERGYE